MEKRKPTKSSGQDTVRWEQVAASEAYRSLIRKKIRFVTAACLFFVVYYFALPVLVGFFPSWMERPVWGKVNLAYLFALSQFFMAWILAGLYVVVAGQFDRQVETALRHPGDGKGKNK